jgi:DNA-binding response OmpR family regulator
MTLEGRRILIVEDELLVAERLAVTVRAAGADVVGPAGVLATATWLAQTEQLDAAILDVHLGKDDITPVAEALMQRSVPFVLHTGDGDRAVLNPHWRDYLVLDKPVSEASLLIALQEAIGE